MISGGGVLRSCKPIRIGPVCSSQSQLDYLVLKLFSLPLLSVVVSHVSVTRLLPFCLQASSTTVSRSYMADGSLLVFRSTDFSRHHQCLDSIGGYVWLSLNLNNIYIYTPSKMESSLQNSMYFFTLQLYLTNKCLHICNNVSPDWNTILMFFSMFERLCSQRSTIVSSLNIPTERL